MALQSQKNYSKTLERIEYDILTGVLKPRERLLEFELMDRYGASRGAIRKAFQALANRRLIKHTPHRGAEVTELTPREMEDLLTTRAHVEDLALDLAAARIQDPDIDRAEYWAGRFEKAVESTSVREMIESNRAFHQTIIEASGNQVLAEIADDLRTRSHLWQQYRPVFSERISRTLGDHRAMIDRLKQRDAGGLKEVNQRHLDGGWFTFLEDAATPSRRLPWRKRGSESN
jgi:DNA-binding GntR family transcriptional regulator